MARFTLAILALSVTGSVAMAQSTPTRFPDVEYLQGHPALTKKKNGSLVLGDSSLMFRDDYDQLFVEIPFRQIRGVDEQGEIRDASVGKKLLFGGLAGSRKQEFVRITWETETDAGQAIWKVKQRTAGNTATKIRFAVKVFTGVDPNASATTIPAPPPG